MQNFSPVGARGIIEFRLYLYSPNLVFIQVRLARSAKTSLSRALPSTSPVSSADVAALDPPGGPDPLDSRARLDEKRSLNQRCAMLFLCEPSTCYLAIYYRLTIILHPSQKNIPQRHNAIIGEKKNLRTPAFLQICGEVEL